MEPPCTPSGHAFRDSLDEPPIVDGAILEAAKENIQPLARGRRATALSHALTTPHRERPQRLAQEREAMREQLQQAIDEDEDPLGAYVLFVDWTIESYPQGHNSDSGLITLFDEATRTLKDDPRYKNDIRYLKLWILYASYIEKPVDIFAFLLANDIGSVYTLFYEEYTLALERDGRCVLPVTQSHQLSRSSLDAPMPTRCTDLASTDAHGRSNAFRLDTRSSSFA